MNGKIITSRPVDRQAAMVTGRGVHWEPAKKTLVQPWDVRSETPMPTRPWPPFSMGQDNLTGRVVGRMTVIGLSAVSGGSKGARWVCRCACGAFEHRTTRALRKALPSRIMCTHCDYLEQLKAGRVP